MLGLFLKEKIKCDIYQFVSKYMRRTQTPMKQVILQLQQKGYWNPQKISALEMFGMFGLWHTKDYVNQVKHIDFFEIDRKCIQYAKRVFKKEDMTFYCADSIKYLKRTHVRYDLIVADIPYAFTDGFDKNTGLPPFLKDMIHAVSTRGGGYGIIIMNIHSSYIKNYRKINEAVVSSSDKDVRDIFYVIRNPKITYAVFVFGA